jgi:hypothetical protein
MGADANEQEIILEQVDIEKTGLAEFEEKTNLNTASIEDIYARTLLFKSEIEKLLVLRDQKHGFKTWCEINDSMSLSETKLRQLYTNYYLGNFPHFKLNSELYGYVKYNPNNQHPRQFQRITITDEINDLRFLGAIGSDKGETNLTDFYALGFESNLFSPNLKLYAGDIVRKYGQGLVYGTDWDGIKSWELISDAHKTNNGMSLLTSEWEQDVVRGAGVQYTLGKHNIDLLYGKSPYDGGSDTLPTGEEVIYSVDETGYHVTDLEKARKDSLQVNTFLAAYEYTIEDKLNLGASIGYWQFNPALYRARQSQGLDTTGSYQHRWRGEQGSPINLWFDLQGKVNAYGELAYIQERNAIAGVVGIIKETPRIDFTLHYRYADPAFDWLTSGGWFKSECRNETGLYTAGIIHFSNKLDFGMYFDFFRNPYPPFNEDFPYHGYITRIQLCKHFQDGEVRTRWRYRWQGLEESPSGEIINPEVKSDIRSDFIYKNFHLLFSLSSNLSSLGLFLANELSYPNWSISLWNFDIPDYDNVTGWVRPSFKGMNQLENVYGKGYGICLTGRIKIAQRFIGASVLYKDYRYQEEHTQSSAIGINYQISY